METVINDVRIIMKETYSKLVSFKRKENRESFNSELLKVLPQIYRYVSKRLNSAVANGKLNKGMFNPNDFTDQLFIEVYDNIDDIKTENELHIFLFKKVDELLEDSLVEEEFDHVFFDNIDTYSKPEWDAMEENYTQDGDGDFLLLEELDDKSVDKSNYSLNQVFITEEEKQLADKLDESLNKERIYRHIQLVLDKMNMPMRTVFELYANEGLTTEEIAEIRKATLSQVEDLLSSARKLLKDSFEKRFLFQSN
ncbi:MULTISPECIES: RNA polymerase sigma factor [Maribacter]|jgi:RNA polymerase sigma factor (sigma-70 family)|uniref:RNA polymerase sigma factor n=1 Tax=Maribacter TaxID=252356 RepID=UPI00047873FF|nr:sigma-70 family RNA polymerase sigma factor [Maribacter sp. Hel_I_7]|tara:strand:- start:686 stop:1444 length:759 start_codon:yes stop_codon:yes gene_type:complete